MSDTAPHRQAPNTAAGLADLVRALAEQAPGSRFNRAGMDGCARLLGLYREPEPEEEPTPASRRASPGKDGASRRDPSTATAAIPEVEHVRLPFWQATKYELYPRHGAGGGGAADAKTPTVPPLTEQQLEPTPMPALDTPPLEPWSRLWPRLAEHLGTQQGSRRLDERALVRRVAAGLALTKLPCVQRRRWARRVLLVHDRSVDEQWLLHDQCWLTEQLDRVMGKNAVQVRLMSDGPLAPTYDPQRRCYDDFRHTTPDTPLLLLGSLRLPLAEPGPADADVLAARTRRELEETQGQPWRCLGRRLRARGYRAAVLDALPRQQSLSTLGMNWGRLRWQLSGYQQRFNAAERRTRAELLLTLLAPAVVVSLSLFRHIRRLLPATQADGGTEADVWSHPQVERTAYGLRLLPKHADGWLRRFDALGDLALKEAAWRLIVRDQSVYGREVNHLCSLRLMMLPMGMAAGAAGQGAEGATDGDAACVVSAAERAAAARFAKQLGLGDDGVPAVGVSATLQHWFRDHGGLLPIEAYEDERLGGALLRMWRRSMPADAPHPDGIDPRFKLPSTSLSQPRERHLRHHHKGLHFVEDGSRAAHVSANIGSHVGGVRLRADSIMLSWGGRRTFPSAQEVSARTDLRMQSQVRIGSGLSALDLKRLTLPSWAMEIGRDCHGLWASFEVGDGIQRMRWIPPGRFMMGSPEGEPGRDEDEGPQHEVVIRDGFWLGETPCTQALWTAVMGSNPSRFQSANRPVEQVDVAAVEAFMDKLSKSLSSLPGALPHPSFRLPSEAEWEYACRAGTTEATYAGRMQIVGTNNAPVLHEIAWYGGNSGRKFDMEDGYDSSDWPEKQFDHRRAGTRIVATKKCNPWGLHDMLGNVWEWCADEWCDYEASSEPRLAELVPARRDGSRVVRGGSWFDRARDVRAAYRGALPPAFARDYLGFRISRGQEPASPQSAEQAEGRGGGAAREGAERPTSPSAGRRRRSRPWGGKG